MAAEHRRARRAAGVIATAVVALAGGFGLLLFFVARDDAPVRSHTTSTGAAQDPGVRDPAQGARDLPPASLPRFRRALRAGNVVLVYGTPASPAALTRLASANNGGPVDRALEQAGQAVLLVPRPGTRGVVALAYARVLRVPSASDPELARFVDAWLGRGAAG
ncbi:MAG: hypothetical protein QOI91_193 [Solirubrobacteraceae bacterium]|nr:hypothetical protein [Solirubrobacteraceae bacterium]